MTEPDITIEHDPGDEDRSDHDVCPFCWRPLRYRSAWITALREESYIDWSECMAKPMSPKDYVKVQQLVTCRRDACKDEAKKIQQESFKSKGKKQRDAYHAQMERRFDPPIGFKDKDWL